METLELSEVEMWEVDEFTLDEPFDCCLPTMTVEVPAFKPAAPIQSREPKSCKTVPYMPAVKAELIKQCTPGRFTTIPCMAAVGK